MTSVEVGRFIEAIKAISEQSERSARRQYPGPAGSAFVAGIISLRDDIVTGIDVREFVSADSKQVSDEDLAETMTVFCFRWCAYSREQEPGTHTVCARCPLARHTVQRIARGASAAKGT